MRRKLIVRSVCPLCGNDVEEVPDGILKREPHYHNAEFVVTHSGYKQYIHTSCWDNMIERQRGKK